MDVVVALQHRGSRGPVAVAVPFSIVGPYLYRRRIVTAA